LEVRAVKSMDNSEFPPRIIQQAGHGVSSVDYKLACCFILDN
jgi:hypothetical protein